MGGRIDAYLHRFTSTLADGLGCRCAAGSWPGTTASDFYSDTGSAGRFWSHNSARCKDKSWGCGVGKQFGYYILVWPYDTSIGWTRWFRVFHRIRRTFKSWRSRERCE